MGWWRARVNRPRKRQAKEEEFCNEKIVGQALVLVLTLSVSSLALANTATVTQEGNDNGVNIAQEGA